MVQLPPIAFQPPPLEVGVLFGLLVFVVALIRYELEMSIFVSALLSVSVLSIGLMLTLSLRLIVGLTIFETAGSLGALLLIAGISYELMTIQGHPG